MLFFCRLHETVPAWSQIIYSLDSTCHATFYTALGGMSHTTVRSVAEELTCVQWPRYGIPLLFNGAGFLNISRVIRYNSQELQLLY